MNTHLVDQRISRLIRSGLLLYLIASLCSCTMIHVYGSKESTTSVHSGVLSVSAGLDEDTLLIRTSGFGFVPLAEGLGIGSISQDLVVIGNKTKCQVIVVVQNSIDANSLSNQLQTAGISLGRLCEVRLDRKSK